MILVQQSAASGAAKSKDKGKAKATEAVDATEEIEVPDGSATEEGDDGSGYEDVKVCHPPLVVSAR